MMRRALRLDMSISGRSKSSEVFLWIFSLLKGIITIKDNFDYF